MINTTKKRFWLKNEFSNKKDEYCPVKRWFTRAKGVAFYPEEVKTELDEEDIVVGEYLFDGRYWCFSLFTEYEYLSV